MSIPNVRLIVLLRDPVDRAYSHYQHRRRAGREELSFEAALEAEERRLKGTDELIEINRRYRRHHFHRAYFRRGLYAEQLERWLEFFPRRQLLVVRAEDYFARPAETHAEILEFIGVRPWEFERMEHRNNASYPPIDPRTRAELAQRYAGPNARLEGLLGRDFGWSSSASLLRVAEESDFEPRTAAGSSG